MDKKLLNKIESFYSAYPARSWNAGQIIIQAFDIPAGVYYIESGTLRQYTIDYRGEEVVVNNFYTPAFVPMSWAVNDIENEYYFETTEDSVLRCAPKEDVLQFIEDNPDVTLNLLSRLYTGMDGVLMRMVHLMSRSAYARVVYELLIHARRLKNSDTNNILLHVKEYELGTYCGLSKETVSREFKKLKAKNLVSINTGGITIMSLDLLELELSKHN